jgi:hypothetical protein
LLPALLLAAGIAILGNGLLTYTAPVEAAPVAQALASYEPLPTVPPGITLPGGTVGSGS